MKKELLASSAVSIVLLIYIVFVEVISPEYQQYQTAYQDVLRKRGADAALFPLGVKQLYLEDLDRVDRCLSCHTAIEDPQMREAEQPLTAHPGDYLEIHDVRRIGCTICHDGQGRALAADKAHAVTVENWEKPILPGQFVYSNCLRCHEAENISGADILRQGREIFFSSGCLGCHKYKGRGGKLGPDLTNIADASPHIKHPITKEAIEFISQYEWNENIGYIYESVTIPHAQPEDTAMFDFHLSKEDALAVTLFLKGLSRKAVPASYLEEIHEKREPEQLDGQGLYKKYCIACHGMDGTGGRKNINYAKRTVPALNTMAEKLFIEYPEDAEYVADLLRHGTDIAHMTPPLDLDSSRRVIAQFEAVKNVIKNGSPAAKADPNGPPPKLHMPSWADGLTDQNIDNIIAYLLSLYDWPDEEYEDEYE